MDALGNLIARKGTKGKNGRRIMLAAHMDEIGLMATHIDENGFIRFTGVGGIRPHAVGGRVRFMDGTPGVIGTERSGCRPNCPRLQQCFIDVGASSEKDCPVKVGDVCAFERPFLDLGKRLVAKSMDDRIGCAVLIETLRAMKTITPRALFRLHHAGGEWARAAPTTSAFGDRPRHWPGGGRYLHRRYPQGAPRWKSAWAMARRSRSRMAGMLADPRMVEWMVRTAEKAKIPYQREVLEGGTTDARAIQTGAGRVPAGCLSVPCRYVHSLPRWWITTMYRIPSNCWLLCWPFRLICRLKKWALRPFFQ